MVGRLLLEAQLAFSREAEPFIVFRSLSTMQSHHLRQDLLQRALYYRQKGWVAVLDNANSIWYKC